MKFTKIYIVLITICLNVFILLTSTKPGRTEMDTRGIIAIVVAIIGLIGVVIGDIIQVFRQGKHVNEIKSDTSYMKHKIDNIDDKTQKIRDEIVEKIVPHLNTSEGAIKYISSKVEILYHEEEYKKRIRSENGKFNQEIT